MHIKNIELRNYRNYEYENVDFSQGVNIITGKNAQGKTNLAEALYMAAFARSFRTSKDSELIYFGKEQAKIKISLTSEDNDSVLDINIGGKGKNILCDGVRISRYSELLEKVFVVIFSPEDLKLVKDVPELRRKFIDKEISKLSPLYYENLYNYKKVLKQRNIYLKENIVEKEVLSLWDYQLSLYGKKIIEKRAEFIKKLEKISSEIHSKITSGNEILTLEYEADISPDENYEKIIEASYEKDIQQRNTKHGPHKDDIKICINGKDARHFGSQGQQRTAALSLKLAEIRLIKELTGEDAVLILDDVLSELDVNRQNFLINSLENTQLFITATELSENLLKKLPEGKIFIVENGCVKEKE